MALGTLILSTDGHTRRYKAVEAEKALRYYLILTGAVDEPTEAEAEALTYIVDIKLPPSHRPDGYQAIDSPFKGDRKAVDIRPLEDPKAPGPDHLTHEGIQQGMYEALPKGDR